MQKPQAKNSFILLASLTLIWEETNTFTQMTLFWKDFCLNYKKILESEVEAQPKFMKHLISSIP